MGYQLEQETSAATPRWIEPQTRLLLNDLIAALTQAYKDVLAVVLYGSVARHEERPLDDAHPSDVDVLAVFDDDDPQLTAHRGMEITRTLNQAYARHVDAPRDVQVMFASRTLGEWDPTFVASVLRDGLLLWTRQPLPDVLKPLLGRHIPARLADETHGGDVSHSTAGD